MALQFAPGENTILQTPLPTFDVGVVYYVIAETLTSKRVLVRKAIYQGSYATVDKLLSHQSADRVYVFQTCDHQAVATNDPALVFTSWDDVCNMCKTQKVAAFLHYLDI